MGTRKLLLFSLLWSMHQKQPDMRIVKCQHTLTGHEIFLRAEPHQCIFPPHCHQILLNFVTLSVYHLNGQELDSFQSIVFFHHVVLVSNKLLEESS